MQRPEYWACSVCTLWSVLIIFNVIVLASLFFLLLFEEVRYRRFRRRIAAVRGNLLSLAHQLRSPLSTLRKYGHILQERELGAVSVAQAEALSRMEGAREDMMIRLNRFLAASRLEEGEIAVKPVRLNLAESVAAALESVAALTQKRKITVSIRGGKRLSVTADPLLLHGILDELLLNAAAYTGPRGSITIHVAAKAGKMEVRIRDTGIGISESEKPHVFEKFFRGERARTMHEGNGLGLYFARQFASALGGKLSFVSTVNSGTTFTLLLPARG